MSKELTEEELYKAYEKNGSIGVEILCKPYGLPRALCESCEDNTPTWQNVCAVCFSARE